MIHKTLEISFKHARCRYPSIPSKDVFREAARHEIFAQSVVPNEIPKRLDRVWINWWDVNESDISIGVSYDLLGITRITNLGIDNSYS